MFYVEAKRREREKDIEIEKKIKEEEKAVQMRQKQAGKRVLECKRNNPRAAVCYIQVQEKRKYGKKCRIYQSGKHDPTKRKI